jgi:hypothetical protein
MAFNRPVNMRSFSNKIFRYLYNGDNQQKLSNYMGLTA